ncbi:ABC transporter permease, partial [Mesorhizobium sp. M2A.F.Ca.ET.017.03.2.1]
MAKVEAIHFEANKGGNPRRLRTFLRQLRKNRLGVLGAVLVVLVFASAIFAPLIIT